MVIILDMATSLLALPHDTTSTCQAARLHLQPAITLRIAIDSPHGQDRTQLVHLACSSLSVAILRDRKKSTKAPNFVRQCPQVSVCVGVKMGVNPKALTMTVIVRAFGLTPILTPTHTDTCGHWRTKLGAFVDFFRSRSIATDKDEHARWTSWVLS